MDVFNQEVTKDSKITLIRYLHQKIYTKHIWNVENNVKIRLNMNQIGFTGEPVTGRTRQSCTNVSHIGT